MSLQNLLTEMESVKFQAEMEVFSSFGTFYSALQNNPLVQELISSIKASSELPREVFKRFLTILRNNPYPGYAHPDDVTLAAYLYVLDQVRLELARVAVEQASSSQDTWWTKQLATRLQKVQRTKLSQFELSMGNLSHHLHNVSQSNQLSTYQFAHSDYQGIRMSFQRSIASAVATMSLKQKK